MDGTEAIQRKPFKQRFTFEERRKEADKIFSKYPDRLPIICERGVTKSAQVPDIDRNKFLVSKDTSMGVFQSVLRRRLATDESTALFFFVGGNKMAPQGELMAALYERYKEPDGFLYIVYTGENTLGSVALDVVEQFATYEDYLDAQVTETDMYFLEDEDLARQLVELGYRGSGDTLKREEFESRKRAVRERNTQKTAVPKQLASAGRDLKASPLLQALASREELVRNGKLTSVIFLRDRNAKGQETSGYIDYAHRLKTENFEPYFDGRKKLMPKPTDLSYYNWETQTSTSNSSPNFQVIAENESGLLFKNKRDRKIINVDPYGHPGDNSTRVEIRSPEYMQVAIYDHLTRRKT